MEYHIEKYMITINLLIRILYTPTNEKLIKIFNALKH